MNAAYITLGVGLGLYLAVAAHFAGLALKYPGRTWGVTFWVVAFALAWPALPWIIRNKGKL